ncbi:MAG: hypothetical protein ACOYNG_08640, partial [Terrimicrobiaceae bacterium]
MKPSIKHYARQILRVFPTIILIPTLLAGPGHDHHHGPEMGAAAHAGPVALSESQRKNLGLETT